MKNNLFSMLVEIMLMEIMLAKIMLAEAQVEVKFLEQRHQVSQKP